MEVQQAFEEMLVAKGIDCRGQIYSMIPSPIQISVELERYLQFWGR